jgi:hypothetical protein
VLWLLLLLVWCPWLDVALWLCMLLIVPMLLLVGALLALALCCTTATSSPRRDPGVQVRLAHRALVLPAGFCVGRSHGSGGIPLVLPEALTSSTPRTDSTNH